MFRLHSAPAVVQAGLQVLQAAGLWWKPQNNKDMFESSGRLG